MIINCDTSRFIYEVLEGNEYSFLFKDLRVLDVGCNIGAFSLWIYEAASEIHAVDLSVRNIEMLNKNIKDNNLGKIKTYCCAIAGKNGTRLAGDPSAPGDGSWMLDKGDVEVDGYTLAHFMSRNRIEKVDVLKLDVEGAEYEILQSPDFPKIPTIIGEFHLGGLGDIFHNLGYKYKELPNNHFIARL